LFPSSCKKKRQINLHPENRKDKKSWKKPNKLKWSGQIDMQSHMRISINIIHVNVYYSDIFLEKKLSIIQTLLRKRNYPFPKAITSATTHKKKGTTTTTTTEF
jgi:hypothetical protein